VSLYVTRVFIMADCEELVPVWLRFVRGVVDCADLPLNVSRETLQRNRQIAQIEKRLTRKVLESLEGLLASRREEYEAFWTAFGSVLKEGIYYDDARRDEVARIALFASSAGEKPCTLQEYAERSPVKQKEIWVLLAPDLERAARSPHLEAFTRRGLEVLFLTDPVDEFVLQRLTEFEGRPLRQIDKGEVDLDGDEAAAPEREAKEKELAPVLEAMRKELSDRVVDVRFSNRLTESPAVLVAGEHDLSPQLERLLREQGRPLPPRRRVLELNATHPLIERLQRLADDDGTFARFSDYCELVWEQALVAEGSPPSDPARFTRLLTELMLSAQTPDRSA
jgi:molecular chaperone HtpG